MAEKPNPLSYLGELSNTLADIRDKAVEIITTEIVRRKTSRDYAVGIDLGTTNSCVAVYRNGHVEVIANEHGKRIIPSYVAYSDNKKIFGGPAKRQSSVNPKNTIYDAKRMIGRKYDDPAVTKKLSTWQFNVVDDNNNINIRVKKSDSRTKFLNPKQVSASILKNIREFSSKYLSHNITKAVITVPAYFNNSQRLATIDAGKMAGFKCIKLINEPTAAAIALGFRKESTEKNILVYDLGGGTFDVSILTTKGDRYDVKAVSGDSDFGGRDLDKLLVKHIVKQVERGNKDVDLSTDSRAMAILQQKCEIAKENLSYSLTQKIYIEKLQRDIDVNLEITRSRFEDLCDDLFENTLTPVEKALSESKLSKEDIHEVVLVGGSTRIPKVQSILQEFFDGKELNKSLNPDEAVACGAAIMAAEMSFDSNLIEVSDVIPMALGLSIKGGINSIIIPSNSKIPVKETSIFCTSYDFQKAAGFLIQEGNSKYSKDTIVLERIIVNRIASARHGETQVHVTFEVDSNGILKVYAVDPKSKSSNRIAVESYKKGRLTEL